jgi:acyl-CoA dehydrogenase
MGSSSNGSAELLRVGPDRSELETVLRAEVNPGARHRDRTVEPLGRAVIERLAATGVLAEPGAPWRRWGRTLAWLGYTADELALPLTLSLQQSIVKQLLRARRPDLEHRYVLPMMRGERTGSFCWSEGADPFDFRTVGAPGRGACVLSGRKSPVTMGVWADFFLVYARDPVHDDVMVVLVERADEGVSTEPCHPLGLRSAGLATLRLDRVSVPADRVLVANDGIGHAQVLLNERRIALPCIAAGKLEALFEALVADLAARQRHGLPVTAMQAVQAELGRCWAILETVRAVVDRLMAYLDRPVDATSTWDAVVAAAKYSVLDHVATMLGIAQRLLGGTWYHDEEPLGRWMRDLQGLLPLAGTQAILEVDLGIAAAAQAGGVR